MLLKKYEELRLFPPHAGKSLTEEARVGAQCIPLHSQF